MVKFHRRFIAAADQDVAREWFQIGAPGVEPAPSGLAEFCEAFNAARAEGIDARDLRLFKKIDLVQQSAARALELLHDLMRELDNDGRDDVSAWPEALQLQSALAAFVAQGTEPVRRKRGRPSGQRWHKLAVRWEPIVRSALGPAATKLSVAAVLAAALSEWEWRSVLIRKAGQRPAEIRKSDLRPDTVASFLRKRRA